MLPKFSIEQILLLLTIQEGNFHFDFSGGGEGIRLSQLFPHLTSSKVRLFPQDCHMTMSWGNFNNKVKVWKNTFLTFGNPSSRSPSWFVRSHEQPTHSMGLFGRKLCIFNSFVLKLSTILKFSNVWPQGTTTQVEPGLAGNVKKFPKRVPLQLLRMGPFSAAAASASQGSIGGGGSLSSPPPTPTLSQ